VADRCCPDAHGLDCRLPTRPGGTPPPLVTARTGPDRVTISPASVRLSSAGTAALRVACPTSAPTACAGRLTLRAVVKVSAKSRRTHTITLGSHAFSVRAGRSATVPIALNTANRRLVARAKRLKSTATATFRNAARLSRSTKRSVTLLPPLPGKAERR